MLRYRMNKLIRLLERNDTEGFNSAISSTKYLKALKALEDEGCIGTTKSWGKDILQVWLKDHYVTYQLSRQDIWKNRIGGYIAGIISGITVSVITAILTGVLPR